MINVKKLLQTTAILSTVTVLCSCSLLNFSKMNPKENISPDAYPHFNVTDVTQVLTCIGQEIDKSPFPATDFIIGSVRDQTKPIDVPGLLATDNTMMMTLALDRFGSKKVSVTSQKGYNKKHNLIQLAGAFTELNRTTRTNAIGGSARISDYEFDLGADTEWNHIAFDLALTQLNRVVNGMTVSVSISVAGDSGDGNVLIQPNDSSSAAIAFGYRNKEGIHAAQRLLIETSLAYLVSKLYQVDPSTCFNQHYIKDAIVQEPDIPNLYKDTTSPSYYHHKKEENTPEQQETALQPPKTVELPKETDKPRKDCQVVLPKIGQSLPKNWGFSWTGSCTPDGYAQGEGSFTLFVDGKEYYKYIGSMNHGYKDGMGRMVYSGGEYRGRFESGFPTEDGILIHGNDAYEAKWDAQSKRVTNGRRIKIKQ